MNKKQQVILEVDQHVRSIPDFPKPGVLFKDIVPVFEHIDYCQKVIDVMLDELKENKIEFNKIVCPEARGFLFGVPLGLATKTGVVLARKANKLPLPGTKISYELEYGIEALEISKDSIQPGDKVLIVDDLLATGGSAKALGQIIELNKAEVSGVLFYLELTPLKGREALSKYKVLSIVPIET
ncbi:MAG: adenine phosphoribosyltransferase [Erysipelotrichia bacterium]|nr:adenine phosphoribosyltransferase [Erysipelotrichia bacterium]